MDNNTAATQDLSDNETPVPGVDTSAIRRVSLLSLRLIILDLTNSFQLLKIIRVFCSGPQRRQAWAHTVNLTYSASNPNGNLHDPLVLILNVRTRGIQPTRCLVSEVFCAIPLFHLWHIEFIYRTGAYVSWLCRALCCCKLSSAWRLRPQWQWLGQQPAAMHVSCSNDANVSYEQACDLHDTRHLPWPPEQLAQYPL